MDVYIYAYKKIALCSTNTKSSEFIQPCSLVLDLMFDASSQPSEHFLKLFEAFLVLAVLFQTAV